jgi:hypothetical protein
MRAKSDKLSRVSYKMHCTEIVTAAFIVTAPLDLTVCTCSEFVTGSPFVSRLHANGHKYSHCLVSYTEPTDLSLGYLSARQSLGLEDMFVLLRNLLSIACCLSMCCIC